MRASEIWYKTDRNIDKINSKIFQFNFASFPFIVIGNLFFTRILYLRYSQVPNCKGGGLGVGRGRIRGRGSTIWATIIECEGGSVIINWNPWIFELVFQIINITMVWFIRILMFNSLFKFLCFLCSNVYVTAFINEIL